MIDVVFDVDILGLEKDLILLDAKLSPAGVSAFLSDIADPFLKERTENRFANEGDDVSGVWQPLKPSTQRIRASRGYGAAHPINIRTRQMIDYMLHSRPDVTVAGDDALLVYPAQNMPSEVAEKIRTAQEGKAYPQTPPRPVIGLSEYDAVLITRDLASWISQGLIGGLAWA